MYKCICEKCKINFEYLGSKRKICLTCRPKNLILSKEECAEIAIKCKTRWEFQKYYYRYYRQSLNKGWLNDICKHMPEPQYTYTKNDCLEKALLCKSRSEFGYLYKSHYNSSLRNKWIDEICSHMENKISVGFSRTVFINNCKSKNNNIGIFYLLKCFNCEENFYKIGITCRSVKMRYSNGSDLPYNWQILWEIKDIPEKIWEMESFYKKQIKNILYTPKLWKCKTSTECFRCHGNSKFLKKNYALNIIEIRKGKI